MSGRDPRNTTPASPTTADTDFELFAASNFASLAVLAGTVAASRSEGQTIARKVLSRALRRWAKVSLLDAPGLWVRRAAVDLALNHRRHSTHESNSLLRAGATRTQSAETRRGDPAVWSAIDALEPQHRAVVALRSLEDLPIAQIAEILDVSCEVATSDLREAHVFLADALGEIRG